MSMIGRTQFLSLRQNASSITKSLRTVWRMAEKFGDISAVTLLSQILREGQDADEELTDLADCGTSVRLPKLGLWP